MGIEENSGQEFGENTGHDPSFVVPPYIICLFMGSVVFLALFFGPGVSLEALNTTVLTIRGSTGGLP